MLPSPIPHPLDYSPWDLPGWAYEALDWVVGVEWPEGNERAVWDLADQWYAVAGALTGPRADAIAAATEVRSGYGGAGAVPEAFEAAWRRLADGDEAPLSVLLAVSTDLGRLVEECGCDIEAAKLEVWIELGILVVELLALAVAAALTAGAASPAAGAAVTASRLVIQQIFRRLLAQLAKKALRQGLKEAGERAAKEVAKDGMRGLGKRAVRGGLFEAGEEAGVSLATQAYQNSTGRRHGLDVADLGASAVGGFAGGAVAPLAGLGRHATGRGARVGEHFGREMTGEVLAEGAAGLATGQGVMSLEEASRAAVSGVSGSATGQADAALHARLDGRLHSLADVSPVSAAFPVPPPPVLTGGDQAALSVDAPGRPSADAPVPRQAAPVDPTVVAGNGTGAAVEAPPPVPTDHSRVDAVVGQVDRPAGPSSAPPPVPLVAAPDRPADAAPALIADRSVSSSPTLSSVTADQVTSPLMAGRAGETTPGAAVAAPPGVDTAPVNPAASVTTAGGPAVGTAAASPPTADPAPGRAASAAPTAGVPVGSAAGVPPGPAPTVGPPTHGSAPVAGPDASPAARERPPGTPDDDGERQGARRFPLLGGAGTPARGLASHPSRSPRRHPRPTSHLARERRSGTPRSGRPSGKRSNGVAIRATSRHSDTGSRTDGARTRRPARRRQAAGARRLPDVLPARRSNSNVRADRPWPTGSRD